MDRAISFALRSVDLASEESFQLGRVRVDPQAHEYVLDGKTTHLQPQTLKVLVALHDKLGQVVTRDELIDRCWDGRIVGDDVINRCISLLRRVATESGGFRIETIPRSGYRLVESAAAAGHPVRRHKLLLAAGVVTVLATAFGGALFERAGAAQTQPLVAVEPLKAAAGDETAAALGEGLGSSIERDLAGSETPISMVDPGSRSGISVDMRGTSISDHGELHASLELVAGSSGDIIWAANFDRSARELDQLRDQLSLQVARELHCAYADGRRPYFDADADFARLALAHCDTIGRDFEEGARLDAQMVRLAPAFARGWAEYAMDTAVSARDLPPLLRSEGERRAIVLARHALSLDPHQGLAYTAIGVATRDTSAWWDQERVARRALAVDPTSPEAHNWQSGLFEQIGRLQDSLREAKLSYQFDHFLPGKVNTLIRINIGAGNVDDAQDELNLARRYWPTNPWFDSDELLLGVAGKSPDRASRLLAIGNLRMDPRRRRALASILEWRIAPGPTTKSAAVRAIEAASKGGAATGEQVEMLALLGDLDAAYAIAARLPSTAATPWFGAGLDAFRADPRFMPLAARVGLAQVWLETGLWPDFCRGRLSACRAGASAAVAARRSI